MQVSDRLVTCTIHEGRVPTGLLQTEDQYGPLVACGKPGPMWHTVQKENISTMTAKFITYSKAISLEYAHNAFYSMNLFAFLFAIYLHTYRTVCLQFRGLWNFWTFDE